MGHHGRTGADCGHIWGCTRHRRMCDATRTANHTHARTHTHTPHKHAHNTHTTHTQHTHNTHTHTHTHTHTSHICTACEHTPSYGSSSLELDSVSVMSESASVPAPKRRRTWFNPSCGCRVPFTSWSVMPPATAVTGPAPRDASLSAASELPDAWVSRCEVGWRTTWLGFGFGLRGNVQEGEVVSCDKRPTHAHACRHKNKGG